MKKEDKKLKKLKVIISRKAYKVYFGEIEKDKEYNADNKIVMAENEIKICNHDLIDDILKAIREEVKDEKN